MNIFSTLIGSSIFILGSLFNPLFAQQKVKGTLGIEDLTRKYRLYIPSSYTSDEPMPLVFNLHGITSDDTQQELYTRMNKVAEENGFVVCYPKGKNRAWNVGFPLSPSKADDVKFISTLIDHLATQYNIDLHRVYACGLSNGGYMSYKLACELSDKIAAIASVAGTFVPGEEENCNPGRTVPVMQIHGTADPIVRYKGFSVGMSVPDLINFWRTKNNCVGDATEIAIPNKAKFDFSRATRFEFNDCADKSAVVLYKIKNGAHTWPGAKIILGITNQDFDASTEIWNFFKQFSLEKPTRQRSITPTKAGLRLSPNPTDTALKIELQLDRPSILSRGLYNMQGQQVLATETKDFPAGSVQWDYALANLPIGIYFLKVGNGISVFTKKVVLER